MVCLDQDFKVLRCHQFTIRESSDEVEGVLSLVFLGKICYFTFLQLMMYGFLLDSLDQRQEKLLERFSEGM